jgi:replicative DNA helicase
LMRVKNKKMNNKENEVSEISSSLKNLAKDLDVPVIALSQLSRNVEQRGSSKRPLLSDLRDSGSIEQDADIVLFIYRPEYYKIEQWDDDEQSPTENTAEIDVAKYRNGETGYCRTGCELKYMRFMDVDHLGQDLTGRYFRNQSKPKLPEKEQIEFELPKVSASDAFDEPEPDTPF